jgi:transposase
MARQRYDSTSRYRGIAHRGTEAAMGSLFVGLDVSDYQTAVCVMRATGVVVHESSVPTEPGAIASALRPYRRLLAKVGHESGTKATWLHKELLRKRLPVVCLDARHTHAALSATRNKTDRNDARGIAKVLSRGLYTEAHVRSDAAQRTRDLLNHRLALIRKGVGLRQLVHASLKLAGVTLNKRKDGSGVLKPAPRRVLDPSLVCAIEGTLRVLDAIDREANLLSLLIARLAHEDAVCTRLMTMPGVGPITALSFKSAVDDPARFASSRNMAAFLGLTPRTFQSGGSIVVGHISRRGDRMVRALLFQSACTLINRSKSTSRLKTWSERLREKKGLKVAATACARRMAVILHRMWITEEDFDPTR